MRFMMLLIPKGYETAAPGFTPDPEAVSAMMAYNEALLKAGVLLALDGLRPPSLGARVSFSNGKPIVAEGPFPGTTESLGGYWLIEVNSKQEAVAWATRCPAMDNDVIEVRQLFELEEFAPEVQDMANRFPMMKEQPVQAKGS